LRNASRDAGGRSFDPATSTGRDALFSNSAAWSAASAKAAASLAGAAPKRRGRGAGTGIEARLEGISSITGLRRRSARSIAPSISAGASAACFTEKAPAVTCA